MSGAVGRILRRIPSALLWFGLPAVALATVAAYIVAAIALHVNPPVVPIQGVSMRPTLQTGELVLLEGVDPRQIHKGDIIAVNVPKEARQKYGLPNRVVHRVVKIEHTPAGPLFQTKGDGNAGQDVFTVHGDEVVGRMAGHVPGLGYPLLFFRSTQGEILLGAIALIVLLYFLVGLFEERQATVNGTALGLQAVLEQTEEIKRSLQPASGEPIRERPPGERPTGQQPMGQRPTGEQPTVVLPAGKLPDRNAEMLERLLVAVGEYGEHLRSHTAVMQGLAQATQDLRQATEELRRAATSPSVPIAALQEPVAQGGAFGAAPAEGPAESTADVDSPPSGEPAGPSTEAASDAAVAPPATEPPWARRTRSWAPPPIEPRAMLLLAVGATAAAVYLRRRLKPTGS
jgi:signal peptidase